MSLESFTHPDHLTAQATHIREGYIMGAVPGIITSIDDLESLGRVTVKVNLIDPTTNLPSASYGYAWVIEDFVCANQAGGAHRFLEGDAQCFLIPLLGLPTQWVLLGCVNSYAEPPSPELNRAKGLHGSVTPNGVQKISNDQNQSQVHAFPHGVTQLISPQGDIVDQTQGGARTYLSAVGEVRHENPGSFTQLTPQGDVVQQSKAGARTLLSQDGNAIFASAFQAALQLLRQETKLTGPPDPISAALKQLNSFLGGHVGNAQRILKQIQGVTARMPNGILASAIAQAEPLLKQLGNGLGRTIAPGLDALKVLQKATPSQLGGLVTQQIGAALNFNLDQVVPQISAIVNQKLPTSALTQTLETLLQKPLKPETIAALGGLSYDPKLQVQAVLDSVLPEGFGQVKTLLGLDLADKIAPLQRLLTQVPTFAANETDATAYETWIKRQIQKVQGLLPKPLQKLLKPAFLRNLMEGTSNPVEALVGKVQQTLVTKVQNLMQATAPILEKVAPVQKLVQAIREGTPIADAIQGLKLPGLKGFTKPAEMMRAALSGLTKQLQPLLSKGMEQMNQMLNAIPGDANRAILKLQQNFSELAAGELGPSAKMRVDRTTAEMVAPGEMNRLFAGLKGAGIRTPHGRFSLGAGGGNFFFPQGQMAMAAAGAALTLGKRGVSLLGLDGVQADPEDEDKVIWARERSRITAQGDTVRLQSLSQGAVEHELTVGPDGILIDGYSVTHLLRLAERFTTLEQRLAQLELAAAPQTP